MKAKPFSKIWQICLICQIHFAKPKLLCMQALGNQNKNTGHGDTDLVNVTSIGTGNFTDLP